MEPLSAQIADVEENIEAIVRRNNVVDEEMQGMKTDIQSLSDKILVIKVSFIRYLIAKRFNDNVISLILGKYQWNDNFWRNVRTIF